MAGLIIYLLLCLPQKPCMQVDYAKGVPNPPTFKDCGRTVETFPPTTRQYYVCEARSLPAIDITKWTPGFVPPPGH